MGRTRRAAIDGGFEQSGSDWYDSGSNLFFGESGYREFSLPFTMYLGGNGVSIDTVTLWANGVLSLGLATQAQIDFFASGLSPIPGPENPGFPGEFFLFDYQDGVRYNTYSYGLGSADYNFPFDGFDTVSAAFFTFENGYQIILDSNGFSILEDINFTSNINGYFIGDFSNQSAGSGFSFEGGYPDFFTYAGSSEADVTTGSMFNDLFLSGAGADFIDGGDGNDRLAYQSSAAGVTVNLLTNGNSGGDAAGDLILNIEEVDGSNFADRIIGNGVGNRLSGFDGDDTILAGDGDDLVNGGAGADTLDGGIGYDTLSYAGSSAGVSVSLATLVTSGGHAEGDEIGNFERLEGSSYADILEASTAGNTINASFGDDLLIGGAGSDFLNGEDGDDLLIGGAGADALNGGFGSDTASYAGLTTALRVNLDGSLASGGDATGDILNSIENIVGTAFGDVITGDFSENRLEGGAGADTIYGGGSGDVLLGGAGADRLYGELGNDTLIGGDDNDVLKGDVGSDVLIGGAGEDSLSGGANSDIMQGDGGNDLFDGGAGADTMSGGTGDDTFYVDNLGDVIIEGSAEGSNDRVFTNISFALGEGVYVEELATTKQTGTGAINLTGNAFANRLVGNAGANILDGGAGADTMDGDLGNDTYIVDNALDIVRENSAAGGVDNVRASVSFSLGKNVENLTLIGTGDFSGSGNDLDNVIRGNSGANLLKGGAGTDALFGGDGNDTLVGGTGIDTMDGGLGDDLYLVDETGEVIIDAGGMDTVSSSVTFSIGGSIENLTLTGTAAINGSGNSLNNVIKGNAGANVLKGGAGNDTLTGGDGNDTLNGGTGADVMDGGLGDDLYFADDAGEVIMDAGGTDTVSSSVTFALTTTIENLTLTGSANINGSGNGLKNTLKGNAGANTLKGGAGEDSLFGGLGADTLSGGTGIDKFYFDTALGGTNVDQIQDFAVVDDTIYLDQSIFGALSTGALAAGAFRVGAVAADADDRIIYDSATGQIWYDADGNGAGAAVQFATVTPGTALTNADFFIVL